jgi:hypothetical protein
MESDTNKNFQIELSCNKILGSTLLVPYELYVVRVGNLLSKDGHCRSFIMRSF